MIIENGRGALCGCWGPEGRKFAVGTGDHKLFIGYYEQKSKWWNTKYLKGFKSSVVTVAFHPSGKVVAAGSTDFSVRFYNCHLEDPNENITDTEISNYKGRFANVSSFGEMIF